MKSKLFVNTLAKTLYFYFYSIPLNRAQILLALPYIVEKINLLRPGVKNYFFLCERDIIPSEMRQK